MADINEIKILLEEIKVELGTMINLMRRIKIGKSSSWKIVELENKVEELEKQTAYRVKMYELLEGRQDDSEQFTRCTSLRFNGIPFNGNQSAAESLNKVKEEIKKHCRLRI